ncbi:MAG: hypothetical protein ACP5I6_00290 [Caldisphaera sp.]|nr:hypothetical protein [Caldisphaera sp.]PMP89832.1 MAG: hypothetical protein C0171_06295 [Caldisphaera sp.]
MKVEIDIDKAKNIGLLISKLVPQNIDLYDNIDYYPPLNASKSDVFNYFLVMVSIDHRLRYKNKVYEGIIDNRSYRGADALYKLGSLKFNEDPSFFYPESLSEISEEKVKKWLSITDKNGKIIYPDDIRVRAELLKDLGNKLKKFYKDPYDLIIESQGYLRKGVNNGFIDLLKIFKAYQDPVEKKAFLLAKFLERRSILKINDPYNKELPVDNHLSRIALRTGIIELDKETREKISMQLEFTSEEDIILRYNSRIAYRIVSQSSGLDPFILDDILWNFGRNCCTKENPSCKTCNDFCRKINGCNIDGCILAKECKAFSDKNYMIPEHKFATIWWY